MTWTGFEPVLPRLMERRVTALLHRGFIVLNPGQACYGFVVLNPGQACYGFRAAIACLPFQAH